jgi:hypothetical protein
MGALLRHLINPVLADLLYCGAGVGIALIKISSRFAGCCCSIEPVELTKCGYDFITRQEPYCAEVVTTVTIDHALTDHNLLGAALGDVTPQSTRAGHGDPDDIEPYARARMSWRTPVFDNSKGQTLSDCFCCELVPGRLPLGCANDARGAHTPAQGHYLASKSRGLRSEQMISRSGSLIIRRT